MWRPTFDPVPFQLSGRVGVLWFCIVCSCKLYNNVMSFRLQLTQTAFCDQLADALTDNNFDGRRHRTSSEHIVDVLDSPSSGRSAHLTPLKRLRIEKSFQMPYSAEGRCWTCVKYKSSHVCSLCLEDGNVERFYCHITSTRTCYQALLDLDQYHPICAWLCG